MTRLDRVLAIVQAGGKGSRLDVLTRERAKPALPFGGETHLVDYAMSALAGSGVTDVWVDVEYLASTMQPVLAGGRPWDLDRTLGGFRLLATEQGRAPMESGFAAGNGDSLYKVWPQVAEYGADTVIVLSADHVFTLDLRDVIDLHRDKGAECTIVTAQVSTQEATSKAHVDVADDGRVTRVDYKPDQAEHGLVSTEITVYDAAILDRALKELTGEVEGEPNALDSGLGDFGEKLLPWFVERGRTYGFAMPGYWRDLGRLESFLGAHRDLLAGRVDVFDHPQRPVRGRRPQYGPARVEDGAQVSDALLSTGTRVRGTVVRSVLGPGVVVEAGAHVEDSVLFAGVVVRAGASVHTAVVDEDAEIARNAVVGSKPKGTRPREEDMVVVGAGARIGGGVTLEAGARLEPGTTT